MPTYSHVNTFIQSLKTGETNTTKTFAKALKAKGVSVIRDRSSVDPALSKALKAVLKEYGMKAAEIAHVENEWPAAKRNQARLWVLAAVAARRKVAFSWELFSGDEPANRRDQPAAPEPVTIVFRSPRAGVRFTEADVHVTR